MDEKIEEKEMKDNDCEEKTNGFDSPIVVSESNGEIKKLTYSLHEELDKFTSRLDEVFQGFQNLFIEKNRNYARYVGSFRARDTEDVLDEGIELFRFCDQEILGKEIKNKIKELFTKEFNKFIGNDDTKLCDSRFCKHFYEFCIEFGRKNEDIFFDEISNKEIHRGAKDFYPPVDSNELRRRYELSKKKFEDELKNSKKELLEVSDIIKNLEDLCKAIKEDLSKEENPSLRKKLNNFEKNINAYKTFKVLRNIDINNFIEKRFKNKTLEEKIGILGNRINNLLEKDGKSSYNFNGLIKGLSNYIETEKAKDFIGKILAFSDSNKLTSYKIFTIKILNDILRLEKNKVIEENLKEFVKRIKDFYN